MTPRDAVAALLARIDPVGSETLLWSAAFGRVLTEPIRADRDNPACDLSAMDGFAVRLADVARSIPIAGAVVTGTEAPRLGRGEALRIFTGGAVPDGADGVVRLEDVEESAGGITLTAGVRVTPGQNIRRRGENIRDGKVVVGPGRLVDAAVVAVATTFGATELQVRRRVRVGIVVTGDEVHPPDSAVAPWQLRDSNGAALWNMFSGPPWLDCRDTRHACDRPEAVVETLRHALAECDAVLLTGGVSAGAHDHVPYAVEACGAEIVFHKLPIRPGHPLLAAVGPAGQPVLGLPGNPVAAIITARRFAAAALRRRAGIADCTPPVAQVRLPECANKASDLWQYQIVRLTADGEAELIRGNGSGDVVAPAGGDGFIEVPPGATGRGPYPFFSWQL